MDFKEQLRSQLDLLETSCRDYDSGHRVEAIGLAMPLRVIFHQNAASASLLTHLGARFARLLSTATKSPKDHPVASWFSIIQFELDPQACIFRCSPKLNAGRSAHRDVLFEDWWSGETIYRFGHRRIRRKDLVLAAASKDAGNHADADLPPEYRWMLDGAAWKVILKPDNGPEREIVLHGARLAALRQIAHEVLNSRELTALAAP